MDELPTASIHHYLFAEYRRNAKRRGINWHLSKQEFITLVGCACSYCGAEPSHRQFIQWGKNFKQRYSSLEPVNGIDRVDNSQGYVMSNCAACCTRCNRIKMSMGITELVNHLRQMLAWMCK